MKIENKKKERANIIVDTWEKTDTWMCLVGSSNVGAGVELRMVPKIIKWKKFKSGPTNAPPCPPHYNLTRQLLNGITWNQGKIKEQEKGINQWRFCRTGPPLFRKTPVYYKKITTRWYIYIYQYLTIKIEIDIFNIII